MAAGSETTRNVKRSAARTVTNGLLLALSLGLIGGWTSSGLYHLELGEAAIIMRLGAFDRVERREGWAWHLPEPLEFDVPVNVAEIRSISFGMDAGVAPTMSDDGRRIGREEDGGTFSRFVQTADNNIVSVSYELQYLVNNPYSAAFGMVDPDRILHDATQAALRQVIGGKSVDNVLIYEKKRIEQETRAVLTGVLAEYAALIIRDDAEIVGEAAAPGELDERSPFVIEKVSLQTVHPPSQVRGAFEDVKAAQQDEDRAKSRARGDAREIIEQARAGASELEEGSQAYKQARVLESRGEAQRFSALLTEYRLAPQVTRRRLHLETMEIVLARADKMVVDPSTAGVIPIFTERGRGVLAPPAVSSEPPRASTKPVDTSPGTTNASEGEDR